MLLHPTLTEIDTVPTAASLHPSEALLRTTCTYRISVTQVVGAKNRSQGAVRKQQKLQLLRKTLPWMYLLKSTDKLKQLCPHGHSWQLKGSRLGHIQKSPTEIRILSEKDKKRQKNISKNSILAELSYWNKFQRKWKTESSYLNKSMAR